MHVRPVDAVLNLNCLVLGNHVPDVRRKFLGRWVRHALARERLLELLFDFHEGLAPILGSLLLDMNVVWPLAAEGLELVAYDYLLAGGWPDPTGGGAIRPGLTVGTL